MVDVGSQILARIEASRQSEFPDIMELELEFKTKKVTETFSETVHIIGNDPSMALYRLQEHVRKNLPAMSEKRVEVDNVQQQTEGVCFDAEYASSALEQVHKSRQYFNSIDENLSKAIHLKQELNKVANARSMDSVNQGDIASVLQ